MPRWCCAGRPIRSRVVLHDGRCDPGLSSLESSAGETYGAGDASEGGAPAAGCGPSRGDRLGSGRTHERGAQECRRSRAGAGAPPQQRRVQQHHPRPYRRRHASHPRISGGSCQYRRLRQLRRVAGHVAGPAKQILAGRARSRRSHGAHAGRVRFRAAPDAGGDGSRPVRDPTDHRLL